MDIGKGEPAAEPTTFHHPHCSFGATHGPAGDICNCAMAVSYPAYHTLRQALDRSTQEIDRLTQLTRTHAEDAINATRTHAQQMERVKNILAYIADCQPDGLRYLKEAQALGTDYGEEQQHERDDLRHQLAAAQTKLTELKSQKDQAYLERNHLVAALTRCYPSGIRPTAIPGWSSDWHGCVYLDLPDGQVSYHYPDSQASLFNSLPTYTKPYDGHTKHDVHQRLHSIRLQVSIPSDHPTQAPLSPTYEIIPRLLEGLTQIIGHAHGGALLGEPEAHRACLSIEVHAQHLLALLPPLSPPSPR